MRSAVDEILAFNRDFPRDCLNHKLEKLSASPFGLFRGTFHLWARDLEAGAFRKWPATQSRGAIVGDLHTENFGAFRAVTGDIVYDVNDFDETTEGCYEHDLRRLGTSLVLAALENRQRLGDGVNAAETMVRAYLDTLVRLARLRKRAEFEKLPEAKQVRRLLHSAAEKSRVEFLKTLAVETQPGAFALCPRENYLPVKDKMRRAAKRALPLFLNTCLAPPKARPKKYTFQDTAFRIAGAGSLGRARYAVLVGKGKKDGETWETLRLIEWKESLESALDFARVRHGRKRAQAVFEATRSFQLFPKRYLGCTEMLGLPMQAREIGANDARFNHKEFRDLERYLGASRIFGEIMARVHLLGSLGRKGPREFPHEVSRSEDRFVGRVLGFAVAYTGRVLEAYDELRRRKEEVAREWG